MYVVEKKHSFSSEASFNVAESLEEASEYGRQFAESYGFQVTQDGDLLDGDLSSSTLSNVTTHRTTGGDTGVLSFMHAGGDGPCLRVVEAD